MTSSVANLPNSAKVPRTGKLFTPLRVYLLCLALLILVVTSPFTVGPGFAYAGVVLTDFYGATRSWAAHAPLTSWFVAGGLGVALVSGFAGVALNADGAGKTCARAVAIILGFVFGIVVLEYLFFCLPAYEALNDAFAATGGTPAWLNGVATFVVVAFANAAHVALVLLVFAALMAGIEKQNR